MIIYWTREMGVVLWAYADLAYYWVVIALLVNLITLFLDRKVALRIIPCLFFYIFIVIGYEILNISQVRMAAMEFIKKCPGWPSYLVIVILCIILGTAVFWSLNVAVNKIDKAQIKKKRKGATAPRFSTFRL